RVVAFTGRMVTLPLINWLVHWGKGESCVASTAPGRPLQPARGYRPVAPADHGYHRRAIDRPEDKGIRALRRIVTCQDHAVAVEGLDSLHHFDLGPVGPAGQHHVTEPSRLPRLL